MTAARYTDQVLQPHSQQHFAKHQNHIFLHNNVRVHTTRLTLDILEQNNVRVTTWPALSPDLNTIERLRDEVQKGIKGMGRHHLNAIHQSHDSQHVQKARCCN